MKLLATLIVSTSLSVVLVACSAQQSSTQSSKQLTDSGSTQEQIGDAITAPLNDLNIMRTAIPEVLRDAQKNPYAVPKDQSCNALANDVKNLDEVLGADLDTPVTSKNPSLVERSVDTISDASISAIKKTTEGVVPFRNWVRKLSGAERASKTVAAAITAGGIRRAYLKGIGQARNCEPPAAPQLIVTKK